MRLTVPVLSTQTNGGWQDAPTPSSVTSPTEGPGSVHSDTSNWIYPSPHLIYKKKTWTDLAIHSIKQRNSLSHSLERYCEILTRKKRKKEIIFPLLITLDIWDTNKNFTIKIQTILQSMETFVQISHYIQRAGVTYSLIMFSLIMMKWYDKVNKSNHWF